MQNIGERLEEARKRQGISIREAAEATKIRADFLIDFENNRFDQDLPDIYKRGFVKIYAKFLGMDVEKISADFSAQQLGYVPARKEKDSLGRVEVQGYKSPYVADEAEEHASDASDRAVYWKVGISLVLLFIVLGLVALFISLLSGGGSSSGNVSQNYVSSSSSQQSSSSQSQASAQAQPASREISLVATGECTVMVRESANKSNILYRGSLSTGERVPLEIPGKVEIVSTEVQNIQVERNGQIKRGVGSGLGKFYIEL